MNRNKKASGPAGSAFTVILFLLLTVLLGSCATSSVKNRGSLSDAMDKSRDDYQGDRTVPDEEREPEPYWRDDEQEDQSDGEEDTAVYASLEGSSEPLALWIGFRGGTAPAPGREMKTLFDADFTAGGAASDRLEIGLYAGIKTAAPVVNSNLDASVRDLLLFFKAGIEGKLIPFPRLPVMSPYLTAGLGGYYMFWSFENSLVSGTDTITSDSIGGFILTAGAGIHVINLKQFRMGVSLIPEIYLFGPVTGEGFDNDYFDYLDTIKIMGEISLLF